MSPPRPPPGPPSAPPAPPDPLSPRPDARLRIGDDNAVTLRVGAANVGEGAFEAELWVQLPDGSFYQRALSHTRVRDSGGGVGCGGGHRVWGGDVGYGVRTSGMGWGHRVRGEDMGCGVGTWGVGW